MKRTCFAMSLGLLVGCGPEVHTMTEGTGDDGAGTVGGDDSTAGEVTPATDSVDISDTSGSSEGGESTDALGESSGDVAETGDTSGGVVCGSPHLDMGDLLSLAGAPIRGNPDGSVTIVEWVDYIEPYSHAVEGTLGELLEGPLGQDIRLIVKQMPLAFNSTARPAARAALAASRQGAFWEYHDALMAWESDQGGPPLDEIAADLGLDMGQFHKDILSEAVDAQIDGDIALLEAFSGGLGTPIFAINGQAVTGAQPLAAFVEVATAERDAFEDLLSGGASRCEAFEVRLAAD